jgi:hypothetical protein
MKNLFYLLFVLPLLFSCGGGSEYNDGVGTTTHYTAKDWDRDATYRKMGEKVWKFCQDHPEAKELNLVIIDECTDSKGNSTEYSQTIVFNKEDIKTFLEYKTDTAFNENCYEFGSLMLSWRPCGNSQY